MKDRERQRDDGGERDGERKVELLVWIKGWYCFHTKRERERDIFQENLMYFTLNHDRERNH